MPSGFRILILPLESGMVTRGDPVGVFTDIEGEAMLVSAYPVEIEGEKTSVTEGPLQGQFPDNE
jgi:hypothetical protein